MQKTMTTARLSPESGKKRLRAFVTSALVALCVLFGTLPGDQLLAAPGGLSVAVSADEIRFCWDSALSGKISIACLPLATNQTTADPVEAPASESIVVWRGEAAQKTAAIARFEGARDRLFAKYQLCSGDGNERLGAPQHVTDFSALPRRRNALGAGVSKKGITCLLNEADGIALGCAQLNENIIIGGLLDLESAEPKAHFIYEGRRIGLRPAAVARLDNQLKTAYRNGQRVTGILLNHVRKDTPPASPLVHPLTDPARVPIGPSAFNTATEEGVFFFRAILHWLVERYTREDGAFGALSGLVIGNEMQSHWSWYHLGNVEPKVVIREYSAALRVADLATRAIHEHFSVYVSLEHHWLMSASEDPTKGFSGLEAIAGIRRISSDGGDFPWALAFHPYPQNLFKAGFWNDRSAPLRFDAPRITFHNLEVLPAFLEQPEYLYEGKVRAIALTEQGFHCMDDAGGELQQAAAFALAWKKVQALPAIESFLYHRHVDHPHEGGLHLGLRAHDGSPDVNGIGKKRAIWGVFKSAGTEEEDAAFAFALPLVGRTDWGGVVSLKFEPPRAAFKEADNLVYDFVQNRDFAHKENVQNVARKLVGPEDEIQRPGLLEHPMPKGPGRLSFKVKLPSDSDEDCLLMFEALLNHEKSTGAAFSVEVEGKEVFAQSLKAGEQVPVEISLNPWRGREVSICWIVDALKDPGYDWTTWVAPRVVLRKRAAL
ncbi:MAG: hypothetical protein EBS01_10245 [Verrucomicrobia bacterium]|nr:hypothetical protein [Verrucomicrobiota bacterium]